GTTDCQTCHKASNAASGLSAGHLIHFATATVFTTYTATPGNRSSGGNYIFACPSCHPRNVSSHANGPVAANSAANIFFGFSSAGRNPAWAPGGTTGTDTQGFNYTNGTGGQCNTTYCHSSGTNVNGNNATYTWATAQGTIGCKGCHNYTTGSGALITTGKHSKHVDGTTYSYSCAKCHNATTTNGTGITDKSRHVNKDKDVVWDATNSDGTAYVNASTACSNIYCHSQGTTFPQPYTGAGKAPRTAVTWGGGQTLGCDGCHGNSTYTGYRNAFPLYVSGAPKGNAHQLHADTRTTPANEPQCLHCHSATTTTNTSITGYANHVNESYNVAAGGTYRDGDNVGGAAVAVTVNYTYNAGGSSCNTVSCHPTGLGDANKAATVAYWNNNHQCADCHKIDLVNTSGYHHAMRNYSGSGAAYPTQAPQGDATSGTNSNNRRCTMCHVDHSIFSPMLNINSNARANNLRTDIAVVPTVTGGYTNSDYIGTSGGTGGICITCHTTELTKSTTRILTETSSTKSAAIPFTSYSGSAHEYAIASTMTGPNGGTFQANCSKCHNGRGSGTTLEPSVFSSLTTATHDRNVRRLYASLGANLADGNDENFCYRCHSKTGDTNPGGGPVKTVANKDYYRTATMSNDAEGIFALFAKTNKHNVAGYTGRHKPSTSAGNEDGTYISNSANKHVECADCHNVHSATAVNPTRGAPGVDPTNSVSNWTAPTGYASVSVNGGDDEYRICFRCHSGYNTGLTSWNAAWTDGGKEFSTNNASYHWVEGDKGAAKADTTYGNFNTTYVFKMMPRYNGFTDAQLRGVKMRCSDCHGSDSAENNPNGPHGSAYAKMLKVPVGSLYTVWNSASKYGDTNIWCYNCHSSTFTNTGFSSGGSNYHTTKHNGYQCMDCHIKVPHGWQIPHLLKPYNMPANYAADNARYNGTGGTGGIDIPLGSANWNKSGAWQESGCGSHQNCN
ncbi:MAG: cytochrome, partial [Geobacteraceae bacterium]